MPLETEDNTDISGTPSPESGVQSPNELAANTNRRVKSKSPGQQQQGGQPGPAAALGSLAQSAGSAISRGVDTAGRDINQAGFANPQKTDWWNPIDWAKQNAQDASVGFGLARRVLSAAGENWSDGVANVWNGHNASSAIEKAALETGVWVNPFSALSAAFQLEDPKQEGLGGLFDVSNTEYAQRQKAQQQGTLDQYNQQEAQRQQQVMKGTEQGLPGSYFDLASTLVTPEDKAAMLAAQGVPAIAQAFLTGSQGDQQNALEWMLFTGVLTYVHIPDGMKAALIKKVPSLERIFNLAASAADSSKQASRAASDPQKSAQLAKQAIPPQQPSAKAVQSTSKAIDIQLSHGAMAEQYSEKPLAKARKPDEPIMLQAAKDPATGKITMPAQTVEQKAIQGILSKLGLSDTDELIDHIRNNRIHDDETIAAIKKNWDGLGLPYDLYGYLPGEQSLRDPRRLTDQLPESQTLAQKLTPGTDKAKILGGKAEGHNFITSLNGYLEQIHRGVFGNGADPMQSLLRSVAGDSRTINLIHEHFMTSVADLLKGQYSESLGVQMGKAAEGDVKAYEKLPIQAQMIIDGWGLLRAAAREESIDTEWSKFFQPNWMPRPEVNLGNVGRKRGRPVRSTAALTDQAQKHRDEALQLDPKGNIVLGQNFQYVADANAALAETRQSLVETLLDPAKKLSKEMENDPEALAIKKLAVTNPAEAGQRAEYLAQAKYPNREANFLKAISRGFAQQVRAIHTESALRQFLDMVAKDGRQLAISPETNRQRQELEEFGYQGINDARFQQYLFHPDLARNLNRYLDHIKLPDFPEFVAADNRKLVMRPENLEHAAELIKQGYGTLDSPFFQGRFGTAKIKGAADLPAAAVNELAKLAMGEKPWLFHPDVNSVADLTSKYGKYYWGKVKDPAWWYSNLLELEGKAISAIMFSPLVHGLNIASRWGMGYMMNPREMTRYLLQRGAKPWDHHADDLALRMEAFNAGLIPHFRNKKWSDNLLSTMSDVLGDIEDQIPDSFKEPSKKTGLSSFTDKVPRPMTKVNNYFWGAVNDFGVMMYHVEKEAALKHGMLEQDAREFAARRANSWMGAVAAEDKNPMIHNTMRLLTFAPNWWRTWAELMVPLYKRAGFSSDHTYLKYRSYQSAKTVAAAIAFQKLTGELFNYVATSSTPWALDGHFQQQNQPNNQDRIEATGQWLDAIPGMDFFAPKENAKTGAVRTFENPMGRQQKAIEEAAGFEEGTGPGTGEKPAFDLNVGPLQIAPYWKPEDTYDGLAKFTASRFSPLLDAAAGATNIDLYQTISDHQLRAINTQAAPGSMSLGSLLTGMMMMTPVGLQFSQNVQKASATGDTSAVESALGTRLPHSIGEFIADMKDPGARTLFSWFTGVNSPYDTAQKTRGTKPSDQDYQRIAELQDQYKSRLQTLDAQFASGQMTPSQWRNAYADLAKQHAVGMEDLFLGSPEYVNGAEGMLNDYMGLYQDPRVVNKDGTINQDMLTKLQNQFRQGKTAEQLQQMNALMRQNDSKHPALKLYHTMLDSYDKFQQGWVTQNHTDLATLHKEISEYSSLYGDTRRSQQYLRQHPDLNKYERAKQQWERTTQAGMLYSMFYGTTSGNRLLGQTGRGRTPSQLAEQLGQQIGA